MTDDLKVKPGAQGGQNREYILWSVFLQCRFTRGCCWMIIRERLCVTGFFPCLLSCCRTAAKAETSLAQSCETPFLIFVMLNVYQVNPVFGRLSLDG